MVGWLMLGAERVPEFVAEDHESVGVVEVGRLGGVDRARVVAGGDAGAVVAEVVELAEGRDFLLGAEVDLDRDFLAGGFGMGRVSRQSSVISPDRCDKKSQQ